MKLKLLVVACALSSSLFALDAKAEADICSDPIQKVCISTTPLRMLREMTLNRMKSEISDEARRNASPKIEEMKRDVPKWRFLRRSVRAYKITQQEIMASAKTRISGLESVVTSPESIALLKSYMKQAIDESKFNEKVKADFKATIDSVIIGNFAEFLDRFDLEGDTSLTNIMSNPCGSDGLVSNAFATTVKNEKYVLICPGLLLTLAGEENEETKFNTVLHTISHEMAHHIDNRKVGNEVYANYLSCLTENYADSLKKSPADAKFCKKVEKHPTACKAKVVESHAGEIIADAWGVKVLNIHARTKAYSAALTDTMIVTTMNHFCGSQDEGIHPTGDFRVESILRMNTDLTSYLGCGQQPMVKAACSLD